MAGQRSVFGPKGKPAATSRPLASLESDLQPTEPDCLPSSCSLVSREPVSTEERILCMLLVDESGSMAASGALRAALVAFPQFRESILAHPDTTRQLSFALVAFAGHPRVLHGYGPVTDWQPPTALGGDNGTAMGTAIQEALRLEEEHMHALGAQGLSVQYSLCFMVTDGYPNSEPKERFEEAIRLIALREGKRKFAFYSIAVEGADINALSRLTPERPPLKLAEVEDFHEFLGWMGKTIKLMSRTKPGTRIVVPNPMKTQPKKGGKGAEPRSPGEGDVDDDGRPHGWAVLT